jgi:hypothetical protein
MSFPLSVQPHSGELHGVELSDGFTMRFVTSVSKTHPASPASATDPLDDPLEDPLDDPLDEPLEDPLDEPLEDELPPSTVVVLPPELLPQPAAMKTAQLLTMRSASAPRSERALMCRFRWRPDWAS